jgi:uncharacterized protein YjiS (DUF1127 family)
MTTLPLAARLARGLDTLTRPLRQRKAYAQLRALDDHLLKDIGMTRVDVEAMRRMW